LVPFGLTMGVQWVVVPLKSHEAGDPVHIP
jgi:hypothetical protein